MLIDSEHLAGLHVLVIGDVMIDRYIHGQVSRISPEAPVPVLSQTETTIRLGGAANVALGVTALGANAEIIGLVGADEQAKALQNLLEDAGVASCRMVVDHSRCTTIKTRVVASHQQIVRIDEEAKHPASSAIEVALVNAIHAAVASADILVISDYAKGVCSDRVIMEAIAKSSELGKPVVVDPKRNDYAIYRGATVITPNVRELHAATSSNGKDDAAIVSASKVLIDQTFSNILVTRSEDGMTLVQPDKEPLNLPARSREVADVSGAGDTVVATLAVMLAAKATLAQAVSLANIAAGIAVSRHGTYAVTLAELKRVTESDNAASSGLAPHLHLAELASLCQEWRQAGLSIGFTNGCFDIIHPGHIKLISEAASLCDKLIVAINSDDSVRRLKGPSRPINTEQSRATVISMLRGVAAVVVFPEDTPLEAIQAILPDVLIKGGDYTVDTIVGAEIVLGLGGKVHVASTLQGHSTTGTVARATLNESAS